LLDRTALGVDGLDAGDGRDPALLGEPAGLRVDRGVGGLPTVDPVAPLRHDDEMGGGEGEGQGEYDDVADGGRRGGRPGDALDGEHDQPAEQRPHGPVPPGPGADEVGGGAQT